MSLPDFTPEEAYLINAMKATPEHGAFNSYMWCYLISGALLGVFALSYGSVPMMLSAFTVVCGFRIYEERTQQRAQPVFRSILEKYDKAMKGLPPMQE